VYWALIDPVPAIAPVNVTLQVPAVRMQLPELKDPPVVPAMKVKVTVPPGTFDIAVVSVTITVTAALQLFAPDCIVQLTLPTLVNVLSLIDGTTTVTVVEAPDNVAPAGLPPTVNM
jgi:hypothetical protein